MIRLQSLLSQVIDTKYAIQCITNGNAITIPHAIEADLVLLIRIVGRLLIYLFQRVRMNGDGVERDGDDEFYKLKGRP